MTTPLFDADYKSFRPLGVGYSLYFKFLEHMMYDCTTTQRSHASLTHTLAYSFAPLSTLSHPCTFVLRQFFIWATLFTTPCIMLCSANMGIPLSEIDPLYLLKLTVANLGTHKDFQTVEYCEEEQLLCAGLEVVGPLGDTNWSTEQAWLLLSFADLGYSLLFVLMMATWGRKLNEEIRSTSGRAMTPADYTIYVSTSAGLPTTSVCSRELCLRCSLAPHYAPTHIIATVTTAGIERAQGH
jgi:hypothetical protein